MMVSIKTHSISRGIAKVETKVVGKARSAKTKALVLKGKALSKASALKGRVLSKEEQWKAKGKVQLNKAKKVALKKKSQTESYVKKHPWKSLGIAAGIGLLFGKIFMRKKRR